MPPFTPPPPKILISWFVNHSSGPWTSTKCKICSPPQSNGFIGLWPDPNQMVWQGENKFGPLVLEPFFWGLKEKKQTTFYDFVFLRLSFIPSTPWYILLLISSSRYQFAVAMIFKLFRKTNPLWTLLKVLLWILSFWFYFILVSDLYCFCQVGESVLDWRFWTEFHQSFWLGLK